MNNFIKIQRLVEEIVTKTLKEQRNEKVYGSTFILPGVAPTQPEDKKEKMKRLRQQFSQERIKNRSNDINTETGRTNLLKPVILDFGDVITRANIIRKLTQSARNSSSRKEFKEYLVQIFESLERLQNSDLIKLQKSYRELVENLNKQTQQEIKENIIEVVLDPNTPEGRKTLLQDFFENINILIQSITEVQKVLNSASDTRTSIVFRNEVKVFGRKIKK